MRHSSTLSVKITPEKILYLVSLICIISGPSLVLINKDIDF